MRDDLDRAVDARIDAYRPDATPPFAGDRGPPAPPRTRPARRRSSRGRRRRGRRRRLRRPGPGLVRARSGRERLAPVAAPAWDGRSGPLAETGDSASDCTGYTLAGLAERTFVFDGTVTAIGDDVSNRPGMGQLDLAGVTFSVNEWYRGDGPDTVTIDLPISGRAVSAGDDDGPSYGVGTRLLVSGEPRWGGDAAFDQPIAWTCGGFTRYYDPETAQAWRQVARRAS